MFVDPSKPKDEKGKVRDAEGKFVSGDTNPLDTAKTTFKAKGTIETLETFSTPTADKPLVSVTVNNPFRKLLEWLQEIKRKQTTTFEFKIKIPLIALPVFLVVLGGAFTFFFNLGKNTNNGQGVILPTPTAVITQKPTLTPAPVRLSKSGIIKASYQVQNLPTPTPQPTDQQVIPTQEPTIYRYVLVEGSEITFLVMPSTVSLQKYINQRALITGMFDSQKYTMTIERISDVEILP